MRLDRLPTAILTERATLRGETVTFGISLTKPSSCDWSDNRDRPRPRRRDGTEIRSPARVVSWGAEIR
jgi:hypothetical protein